ncbi:Sulfite reductase [NADPH] flavoprotein alpha-component [Pigmentiphaga humi]|uniref:assimilatory sulfite reductase (NADPH) n=2 Tax=Pigmentiphaga humi TaxID=2478468 RepID=A0A3P4B7U5_9BURK|nr:Sulfite reductase [NADPH] flavoprotein alpha-component [Pigmentiphaga humi]
MTVLFGTETGNSAAVARTLAERLGERGFDVQLADMADFKPKQLGEAQDLLIVASTYGDGDPPQPAVSFFEFLEGRKAPRLEGSRYAVLALGDSTYEQFCAAGRRLDERLAGLGAESLLPRVDCDVDYEDAASNWIDALLEKLGPDADAGQAQPVSGPAQYDGPGPAAPAGSHDKRNPFRARVLENIVLTGRGSSKEVRHVELSLEGSGLRHEPGDALGLLPRNDPALVQALLDQAGVPRDAAVALKGRDLAIGQALTAELDIVNVTPRFLEQWARLAESEQLKDLSQPANAHERAAFSHTHHIIDVMRKYPVKGVDAAALIAALRPLQPRLYSIASSAAALPGEVHLTIAKVDYELFGEPRQGVMSGFVAGHGRPDAEIPVYVQPSLHFRLPADDAPILMIGAGTGVAPYRAFLQEREARGAAGRSWLFFGERRFRTDFLYQTEWQGWLKDGVLDRMDVAFSRDAAHGAEKTYVWHRLQERGYEVYDWLEQGAHVYVCGDAAQMAPDVHRTLAEIVVRHGGRDIDDAHAYLRDMQQAHRYQRDVY